MSNDPLLQPFKLKHLTLKNRLMITSHEPAYPEDGMPKGRYRAYHAERAKAGIALTMTAGSAAVALDSPPVFNNTSSNGEAIEIGGDPNLKVETSDAAQAFTASTSVRQACAKSSSGCCCWLRASVSASVAAISITSKSEVK